MKSYNNTCAKLLQDASAAHEEMWKGGKLVAERSCRAGVALLWKTMTRGCGAKDYNRLEFDRPDLIGWLVNGLAVQRVR